MLNFSPKALVVYNFAMERPSCLNKAGFSQPAQETLRSQANSGETTEIECTNGKSRVYMDSAASRTIVVL
jgi:hypothetical protein